MMTHNMPPQGAFREGDDVVLAAGPHEGTPGVFVRLCADTKWAAISERNGSVQHHPVVWLAHAAPGTGTPSAHLRPESIEGSLKES